MAQQAQSSSNWLQYTIGDNARPISKHFASALDHAEDQRVLDRLADRTVIVSGDHFRLDAKFVKQSGHAEAKRLHACQVEFRVFFMADAVEPPAGIILPKTGRFDQRQDFKFECVWCDFGQRFLAALLRPSSEFPQQGRCADCNAICKPIDI